MKLLHFQNTPNVFTTLNKMGYSSEVLSDYDRAFIEFAGHAQAPVLDVGAGFGVATLPALANGATVIANDIEPRHLAIIQQKTPQQDLKRLVLSPGKFPDDLNFLEDSLGAVHISQVLHFLSGEKILQGVSLIYRWLQPGGKVFITVGTPYTDVLKDFIPLYEERKRKGIQWPGTIEDLTVYCLHPCGDDNPNFINFMDEDILGDTFQNAGFHIERIGNFSRADLPKELQQSGKEAVGLIAVKPLSP